MTQKLWVIILVKIINIGQRLETESQAKGLEIQEYPADHSYQARILFCQRQAAEPEICADFPPA